MSKDERMLSDIKTLADTIIRQKNKLPQVYRCAGIILNLCEKLENKEMVVKIRDQAVQLISSGDPAEIENIANRIKALFSVEQIEKADTYIDARKIIKKKRYLKDCEIYADRKPENVEAKILAWPNYEKKLHEPIISGKWEGALHARLTDNLRVMYYWDPKKKEVTFEAIIPDEELIKSSRL